MTEWRHKCVRNRRFAYDAKSRLTSAWRRPCGSADFELVVSNVYDHLDRRVQKITPEATYTYFYDGWLLIKETRHLAASRSRKAREQLETRHPAALQSGSDAAGSRVSMEVDEAGSRVSMEEDVIEYHWGKDLSGTIGGAGGVGGLLYLSISNSSTPNSSTRQLYVPWYDAYGNILGYWDAEGHVVAEYTYDAFGKLIASSGPMADVFSFRYSTKYFDPETGFYYYGYRFYSPELMRWITRDPIALGQAGPQVATPEEVITVPVLGVIGGIGGGLVGGIGGFIFGSNVTGKVYDWAFTPLTKEEWEVGCESK